MAFPSQIVMELYAIVSWTEIVLKESIGEIPAKKYMNNVSTSLIVCGNPNTNHWAVRKSYSLNQ